MYGLTQNLCDIMYRVDQKQHQNGKYMNPYANASGVILEKKETGLPIWAMVNVNGLTTGLPFISDKVKATDVDDYQSENNNLWNI